MIKNIIFLTLLLLPNLALADRTGTIVSAGVTVGSSANTFASAYQDEINGGYQVCADVTCRDAIASARRTVGMVCYVISTDTTYRLVGGILNANWAVASPSLTPITLAASNVGISSVTPGAPLDITGVVRSSGGFQSTGSSGVAGAITSPNSIHMDGAHSTLTADALVITTGNNVGIGTNAAASPLTINGTAEMKGFKLTTSPSSGWIIQSNSVGVGTWVNPTTIGISGGPGGSSGQLQRNNSGTLDGVPTSAVDSNGNVGINTTSTGYALNVNGSGIADYSTGTKWLQISGNLGLGTSAPAGKLTLIGNVGIATVAGDSYATVAPPTGGMIIEGNVGIGSTHAPNKIYVVGTPMFTGGLNLGIGTSSPSHLCISNNAISTCL